MTKRIVSLLCALVLMLCAFASAQVTPAGTFPVVDEPIVLKVATAVSSRCEDIETNAFTLWLEEKTGIDLQFVQMSESDTATQVNTIMLGDDLPDIFLGYNFGYSELCSYADAGLILPLEDYIAEYGDEYFNFLEQAAPSVGNAEAYATYNGHVYAVTTIADMVTNMYANTKPRINEDFLANLEMEMPTTLDEMYDYLVAVRDNDANGNGDPDDEIPMTGNETNIKFLYSTIGCCFQFTDYTTYLKVNENGEVEFVANNDLFKQTVEYIKMLVDDELLDPAAFTQAQADHLTLNTQADALVGLDVSYASNNYDSSSALWNALSIIPNLEGPDGYKATYMTPLAVRRTLVMTKACENPEAAFRLFDLLLTDEAGAWGRLGVKDVDWKEAAEGLAGRDGDAAWYELIGAQVWTLPSQNHIWRTEAYLHGDVMNHVAEPADSSTGKLAAGVFKYNLKNEVTGELLPTLLMSAEDDAEYGDLKKLIVDYVNSSIASFALGGKSMDEWDAYVETINNMGVERYVELAQKAYDAMK